METSGWGEGKTSVLSVKTPMLKGVTVEMTWNHFIRFVKSRVMTRIDSLVQAHSQNKLHQDSSQEPATTNNLLIQSLLLKTNENQSCQWQSLNHIFLSSSNYKNTRFLHICCICSQKLSHGDISGTKSGIIDPLVSKRPETNF